MTNEEKLDELDMRYRLAIQDKEIERLNNIINEFDKISYEDWNMWGKYREYIKILSEFADDTQSKLNPYLTDAYKSDIKVAIKVLIRVLKESYTKDIIEELDMRYRLALSLLVFRTGEHVNNFIDTIDKIIGHKYWNFIESDKDL